ncbi:hypothetical protein KEM55_002240 [Ascosphaera atra]|nr:hypothetical protein KEM55_002240 [Ascosphaera atra]
MHVFRDLAGDYVHNIMKEYQAPPLGAMSKGFMVSSGDDECPSLTAPKRRDMIAKRNALQTKYLERWMEMKTDTEGPIDGLIFPINPYAVPPLYHGRIQEYMGYTAFANLLVTYAEKAVDSKRPENWQPLNDMDKDIQGDYDPGFFHGAPVALQIIGQVQPRVGREAAERNGPSKAGLGINISILGESTDIYFRRHFIDQSSCCLA